MKTRYIKCDACSRLQVEEDAVILNGCKNPDKDLFHADGCFEKTFCYEKTFCSERCFWEWAKVQIAQINVEER